MHALDLLAAGHVEHVALAEQLLRALFAQDGARIDLAGDVEADAGRQVGLDHAGDDVDRRTLRRHDQVDARRTRLLCEPLDEEFDLLARRHHQVGQLVDDHHDLRHRFIIELLFLVLRLAADRIPAGLDLFAQRQALGLGDAHLVVEIDEAADLELAHHPIALLHLLHRPFQCAHRLGGLGHHGGEKVRNVVIDRQFEHLGIDHDHAQRFRRHPVKQRKDHRVEADRLARSGGARDQQVRHRREVGDHRIARDVLAQDDRQLAAILGKMARSDHLVQHDRVAMLVGQLDAQLLAAWDRCDARRARRHVARDIVGQLDDAVGLDARRGQQLVTSHHRAGAHRRDLALHVEIAQHRLEQPRVALERNLVQRGACARRRRVEQIDRRQLIRAEEVALLALRAKLRLGRTQRGLSDFRRRSVVGHGFLARRGQRRTAWLDRIVKGIELIFVDHRTDRAAEQRFWHAHLDRRHPQQPALQTQRLPAKRRADQPQQRSAAIERPGGASRRQEGGKELDAPRAHHAKKAAWASREMRRGFTEQDRSRDSQEQHAEQRRDDRAAPVAERLVDPQPVRLNRRDRQQQRARRPAQEQHEIGDPRAACAHPVVDAAACGRVE